jgi:hypothetical protein
MKGWHKYIQKLRNVDILVSMDRCAVKYAGRYAGIYLRQRNLNNIIKAIGSLM